MSPPDLQVARLAARQHHCFARCQALEIGLSYRQIRHRVDVGRWTQLHDSVFCLAGAPIAALGHIHARSWPSPVRPRATAARSTCGANATRRRGSRTSSAATGGAIACTGSTSTRRGCFHSTT